MRLAPHAAHRFQLVQQAGHRAGHLVQGLGQLVGGARGLDREHLQTEVVGETNAEVFFGHRRVELTDQAVAHLAQQQPEAGRSGFRTDHHGGALYFQKIYFSMEILNLEPNAVLQQPEQCGWPP
ncbi:hypothetical protein D3C72_2013870 [compost metagenome]